MSSASPFINFSRILFFFLLQPQDPWLLSSAATDINYSRTLPSASFLLQPQYTWLLSTAASFINYSRALLSSFILLLPQELWLLSSASPDINLSRALLPSFFELPASRPLVIVFCSSRRQLFQEPTAYCLLSHSFRMYYSILLENDHCLKACLIISGLSFRSENLFKVQAFGSLFVCLFVSETRWLIVMMFGNFSLYLVANL